MCTVPGGDSLGSTLSQSLGEVVPGSNSAQSGHRSSRVDGGRVSGVKSGIGQRLEEHRVKQGLFTLVLDLDGESRIPHFLDCSLRAREQKHRFINFDDLARRLDAQPLRIPLCVRIDTRERVDSRREDGITVKNVVIQGCLVHVLSRKSRNVKNRTFARNRQ